MTNSRLPGFYQLSIDERRAVVARERGVTEDELAASFDHGGLDLATADKVTENVLGLYALPFCLGLNFQVNGRDRLIPMVVEEPSVVAAASNAAKMIRAGGGFSARMESPLATAQIELRDVADEATARSNIQAAERALLDSASSALASLVRRGGGPRELEIRGIAPGHLVVHLHVDTVDAMGANLVNTAAEHLSAELCRLAGAKPGLRILTNLTDRRVVEVTAMVPAAALAAGLSLAPAEVVDAIAAASLFAERDPYRAATHNKGIMNGVDSVILATGNDYRAVEAGAHAYAARSGQYRPLATWKRNGDALEGKLAMPMAVGTVGGTLRVHSGAKRALELAEVTSATELAHLAGAAGLASNLAALRALATEGIQRGHMSLHARSLAVSVGAVGSEVEAVASQVMRLGRVTESAAREALDALRSGGQTGEQR